MRVPTLLGALTLLLAGVVATPAQDLIRARKDYRRAVRSPKLETREAALRAYVATADPEGFDTLFEDLEKVDKSLLKVASAIERTGKKLAAAWKSVDRQAAKGRPITVGSVTNAEKKHREIQRQLSELSADQDEMESWRTLLRRGVGRLFDLVTAERRAELLTEWEKRMQRDRKGESRLMLVRCLRYASVPEGRDALAEQALRGPDPDARTAAVDGLGRLRRNDVVPTLGAALGDEAWSVRIAACDALARIPSLAPVPHLVAALEKAEGRYLDEVIEALEDLVGITWHDNPVLWREWWQKKGKGLQSTMEELAAENMVKRAAAMHHVATEGLLAGLHLLLDQKGLGPRPPAEGWDETEKDGDSGEKEATREDADPLADSFRDAVGETISSRPKRIRERAVRRLLIRPFVQEESFERSLDYVALFRGVRVATVRRRLIRFAGISPVDDPETGKPLVKEDRLRLRRAAIEALGYQDDAAAIRPLAYVMDDPVPDEKLQLLAGAALRRLGLKEAVTPLIKGLNNTTPDVKSLCHDALVEITGEDKGEAYGSWRDWWTGAEKDFKTRDAVATGDEEGEDGKLKSATTFYGIETRSKHLVYILDRSGSMTQRDAGAENDTRIDSARKQLIASIRSLPDDATFNIIFYNHEHDTWRKKLADATRANKAAAVKWVESIEAVGNTNIFDPLELAFQLAGRGTHDKSYGVYLDTIFFLSDGQPNRGRIIAPVEILKEVSRMNELKKVKIHTVGIGEGHDAVFMRTLAEMTGGTYVGR